MNHELLLATRPTRASLWRIVENQEQAATRNITRSADEQARLETLLDGNKPAYMPGTGHLHWLLKTPFRYPPLRHGSRFGTQFQPGILYGSRELATAMTESAVYLWLFRAGPMVTGPLDRIADGRTALRFGISHKYCSDLTVSAARSYRERISDPASYTFSQALGTDLRERDAGVIRFYSARAAQGVNSAVIDPQAVRPGVEPLQEHWRVQLDAGTCWWGRPGSPSFEIHYDNLTDASGRIPHPAL